MWNRKELKLQAKDSLRVNYWKSFLITFILLILTGGTGQSINSRMKMGNSDVFNQFQDKLNGFFHMNLEVNPLVLGVLIAFIGLVVSVFAMAYFFFVINAFEVGGSKYFITARKTEGELKQIVFSFQKGKYFPIIKAMAWKTLFQFLWFLLFVIPGIVKYYSYAMVPYLMADNPNLDYKSALKLSMHMTDGHKGKMFVLDLSFIGWFLLAALTLGIGILFLMPYIFATKAELYFALKNEAIQKGLIVPIEE